MTIQMKSPAIFATLTCPDSLKGELKGLMADMFLVQVQESDPDEVVLIYDRMRSEEFQSNKDFKLRANWFAIGWLNAKDPDINRVGI